MRTAMQELKEHMINIGLQGVEEFIDPYIEKEKQQIVDAFGQGEVLQFAKERLDYDPDEQSFTSAETYYNETFNQ